MKPYPTQELTRIRPDKKRINKYWLVLFSILGIVVAAQLIVSNALASRGQELSGLEKQAFELSRENSDAREDLSSKTSLNKVSLSAQQLGFGTPSQVEYINLNEDYAAFAQ